MLIDGDALITRQLMITEVEEMLFADGRSTTLTPVHYIPQLSDKARHISLDGSWKVQYWPFSAKEEELASPQQGDTNWETVAQPGKVFTQQVETVMSSINGWNRITLEHINIDDGALLRREVLIPAEWHGKRIYLTFDAIYPAGRVYLNGQLLGEQTSGLTPVEWDVTDLLTPGTPALVAVRLWRRHQFVQMDMPRHSGEFAGLAQSAYFHCCENCQIADIQIKPTLNSSLTDGEVTGILKIRNFLPQLTVAELTMTLNDPLGKYVAETHHTIDVLPTADSEITISIPVQQPMLWNDEYPNLYLLEIILDSPGQQRQFLQLRCGFRRFDLHDSRALLNGNPVKFRGVNHLTYHPEFGLHTPEAWLRQSMQLMKRANVNCIRTHYLGPRCLADICDELGIYLLQELPIDWGTNYIHDPRWVGPAMQRIHGGVLRDRNHTSVMMWSVGNENMPESLAVAEDGYNHLQIYNHFVKLLDPTRPTIFPPPGPANKIRGILELHQGDVADTHYSFKLIKDFLQTGEVSNPIAWTGEMKTTTREEALARGWSGVWFSSEYGIANLMPDLQQAPYGNIIDDCAQASDAELTTMQMFTARLQREWGYMRDEASCLGGAYFPWLCSAAGNNPWGWTVWAEDNDWGVITADLLPKPEFWALRILFSPIWFPQKVSWRSGEKTIQFELHNQYNAIDLAACTFRTMCGTGNNPGRDWRDVQVICPPGKKTMVDFPLWNEDTIKCLERGLKSIYRILLIDPMGFRPISADIHIQPDSSCSAEGKSTLLIGPDAPL